MVNFHISSRSFFFFLQIPLDFPLHNLNKNGESPKITIDYMGEDGGETGGSRVHFAPGSVKRLPDLRNRVNSQRYSSMCEDQRPKIEDFERSDSKKSA